MRKTFVTTAPASYTACLRSADRCWALSVSWKRSGAAGWAVGGAGGTGAPGAAGAGGVGCAGAGGAGGGCICAIVGSGDGVGDTGDDSTGGIGCSDCSSGVCSGSVTGCASTGGAVATTPSAIATIVAMSRLDVVRIRRPSFSGSRRNLAGEFHCPSELPPDPTIFGHAARSRPERAIIAPHSVPGGPDEARPLLRQRRRPAPWNTTERPDRRRPG